MRILWITNIPIGKAGELFFGRKSNGLWMDAALDDFVKEQAHELFVATTGETRNTRIASDSGVTYYLLPDRIGYKYKSGVKSNLAAIAQMLEEVSPDVIQIWGTEFQVALDVLQCNGGKTPAVVFIQGVVASLSRYMKAGIREKDILLHYSPMDLVAHTGIYSQVKRYRKQAMTEEKVVAAAGNVIGENEWSRAYYAAISEDVKFHACPLQLNHIFADRQWCADTVTPYSIMCNSSNYSIKGLHILLKAMHLLKPRYPKIRLYLPGANQAGKHDLKSTLKQSGYIKYIKKLIRRYELGDSIDFLPFLTPEQMADKMKESNVFVVPSAIENHSSSLKEAMLVGVPSIGTYVGGVSEYVKHGENGFIYRFEEAEVLAYHIGRIFESRELAEKLSQNGRRDMMALHVDYDIHARMIEIYREIIEDEKK